MHDSKAQRVHNLLLAHYGQPTLKPQRDPLTELVLTILSQNTADVNTARAFAALRARFHTWEQVRLAPTADLADAIRVGGLANVKAPRIQHILHTLHAQRGCAELDFLAELTPAQARNYLTALPGVGPKTAACVLLFSLRMPALPVDTHVHRVVLRLGLVPLRTSAERACEHLEAALPPEDYYPFHLNVIRHGRGVCRATKPQCEACVLAGECAHRTQAYLGTLPTVVSATG